MSTYVYFIEFVWFSIQTSSIEVECHILLTEWTEMGGKMVNSIELNGMLGIFEANEYREIVKSVPCVCIEVLIYTYKGVEIEYHSG